MEAEFWAAIKRAHTKSIASVATVTNMKISRPVLVNCTLAVVVLAAVVGGYFVIAKPFAAAGSTGANQLTSTVQQGAVSSTITASGSIAAASDAVTSFAVGGTIATVNTSLGATVAAGAVLGTLDPTTLQKALTRATTTLTNAKSQLADAKTSLAAAQANDQTGSAKQQVNSAQSAVNDATDAVSTATTNLAAATLTAPVAGLVVAVNGSVGSSVSAGSTTSTAAGASTGSDSSSGSGSSAGSGASSGFVTIADVSHLTMTANIAEADIASVTIGQSASVTFPALTNVTATAKVTAISPVATASNSVVTYATTITLDSIPTGLRLGQTAAVAITTASSAATALYVPTAAVTTGTDATSSVKVVSASGKTSTATVKLGVVGDSGTEITSGLTKGETVVIGTVAASTGNPTGGTGSGNTRGGFGGGGGGGFGAGGFGAGGGARNGGAVPGRQVGVNR